MNDDSTALAESSAVPWQALPAAAKRVYAITGAITGGLCSLVGGLIPILIADGMGRGLKAFAAVTLIAAFVAIGIRIGQRRWRNTGWRLDATGLGVRRGRMFYSETLVPRSRVQHLDIERGPIERRYGLATLVVHTAGTRSHALRQSGLAEADALALRDALLPDARRDDDSL